MSTNTRNTIFVNTTLLHTQQEKPYSNEPLGTFNIIVYIAIYLYII